MHILVAVALAAQETPIFRSDAAFIGVDVQVLSDETPVLNLKAKDFLVWDDGKPQAIANFGSEDQVLDIVLLLTSAAARLPFEAGS